MNQRVENELRDILNDLENLGHGEDELISACLKQDGIQVRRRGYAYWAMILGVLIVCICCYALYHAGPRFADDLLVTVERDIPAYIGTSGTLCFPAQVQVKHGNKIIERWHWEYGEYGELNNFIQRFTVVTNTLPLTVTCYRQAKKFVRYNPNLKPIPKSIVWSCVVDTSIRYGVVDEQSRNHGLWIEFLENQPVSAELWNHGHQVGLAKCNADGEWRKLVKVSEFELPSDPVASWSEINEGYYNLNYAKTLVRVEHEMIRHDLTLALLLKPLLSNKIESDENRLAKHGN